MEVDVSKGFDLGCLHYKVEYGGEVDERLRAACLYGACSSQRQMISLCEGETPERLHETFVHEVIEAVVEHCCYKKVEHEEMTNLANGLAQALKSMGVMFVVGSTNPTIKTIRQYSDLALQDDLKEEK